ncbi:DUF4855 domain-containing protein [Sporosarcina beigongshangi]|uniref:DUF4855 domain-containing protein n=1 Tax=Sporosarcina beigongshangi TaxID=2782538 RepID=UPI00193962EA|nr:DUF4855 domain-containing protein [Sporosarcina beigongshangi]
MKRFMQSVVIFMSCLAVTLLYSETAQATIYKDVTYEHWAYADIQFIAEHEVIRGFANGNFVPGANISRKDAAVMMTRALDLVNYENTPIELEDMHANSPSYKEVMIAIERGWLSLTEVKVEVEVENKVEDKDKDKDKTKTETKVAWKFEPNAALTRDEMSRMLAIAYSYEGKNTSNFKDVTQSNPYYKYIDAIAMYEVTTGYNDGTFRPKDKVTRAQFSAFLSRVYQKPIAYEVKSGGQTVAVVPSVEDALEEVAYYEDGTIHPQSNKFIEYSQTIATADRTNLNSGVLIYNGFNEKNSFTPEFFNHYMKHGATEDQAAKAMFDTFIFLGLRYNESGNQFVDGATNQANYEDWDNYIKRTFDPTGAIVNLNESAKQNDRVVDVYIAIPYPKRNGNIITLDGREQDNTVYNRYDMASWYVNNVLNEFSNEKYEHLNFKGFYWLSETVRTVEDEVLISTLSSLVKKHDKFFIYSPHATSTNFYKWSNYGFDAAFLQPNAFRTATPNKEERLHRAFLNAQIYGTGITIEIDSYGAGHVEQGEGVEAFDLYMDFAKRYGLSEKGMMFYQATNMVERMATIDHPVYKRWYDQLTSTFFNK